MDWSVGGSAAAAANFGSPARQPVAAAPQPPAAPLAAPQMAPPAGFVGGSFSPSDASSIESNEADELLGALHAHVSKPAAAAMLARASPHASVAAGVHAAPAPAAAGDADGIDDVLRLQPWLE